MLFNLGIGKFNYLVDFSVKRKLIYVSTPKVACSTVRRTLQLLELDGRTDQLPENPHDKNASPLLSPLDAPDAFAEAMRSQEFFRFSFVRNPFTRTLSCYLDKIHNDNPDRRRCLSELGFNHNATPSFYDFLLAVRRQRYGEMDLHWVPQSFILSKNTIDYSFIGRFENFNDDLRTVITRIQGRQDVNMLYYSPHATRAGEKVSQHIGPREKELILEIYENDFNEFEYSRDLPASC